MLTYTRTPINQAAAGTTIILAASPSHNARLWYLTGSLTANGTIALQSTTGEILIPAFEVLADTQITIGPFENIEHCPKAKTGRGFRLITTGNPFKGYAVMSRGDV